VEVIRSLAACRAPAEGAAVTIGAFDGVHLGHQALLRLVRERGRARGLSTALVTFDRHPALVVRPESAPKLLTTLEQKLELLGATGLVDEAVVLTFDEERRNESAEEFVKEVLVDCLGARLVVVGADFHFGRDRRGNVELLRRMGDDLGFEVVGLDLVSDGPAVYSSTLVRQRLAEGAVEQAAALLGRPHEVRGRVVERPAAISLGHRPTFYEGGAPLLLEAHVLDFDGDLYGQEAAVRFVARIRPEERFDSVPELVAAMHRDVDAVRRALDLSTG
jgi:riboflavin kinase/FMN adenylyltransferase